ncbi:MAG TPA: transcription antitermination factor NusB [Bdellovibrionota bacterium]|nr:transcription antitermination factor NusB [Bdellovibrionota bacterium]
MGSAYPRDLAIRVLTRVLSDGEALDEAIERAWAESSAGLAPSARGWLTEVCSGTLRWKGRLDSAIDSVALKKKPSGWLRKALLVAAYQLIAQERTQPGPVVSETVEEVRRREGEAPAKFANAALRRLAEHAAGWRELALPAGAKAVEAAAWASFPEWLWKQIVSDHGQDFARAYALASLERPAIWLRSRGNDEAPGLEPGPIPGAWRLASGGAVTEIPGFSEGKLIVQDISSQVLVREIGQEVRARVGSAKPTALDLCAAPGGKSVGLAWEGFQVTASDRDSPRMKLLEGTVKRTGGQIRVAGKQEVPGLPQSDLVWIDAPCTGSGILRRHPDVRWLRRPDDLKKLGPLQLELIREGWAKVKPGGFLAYSVCSVLALEGPDLVARAALEGAQELRSWRLSPQEPPHGDGFWAVLLHKR